VSAEPFILPETVPWHRRRAIMLAVVGALALGAAAIAAAVTLPRLLSAEPGGPIVHAGVLPADTAVYLELDLEPEGTQAVALGALTERLGATGAGAGVARLLEPLVEGFTAGAYSYERDVEPWFDGHAALAVLDLANLGLGGLFMPSPVEAAAPGAVVVLGVEDRAAVTQLTDRLRADASEAGVGFVSREIGDWSVWHADAVAPGAPGVAFAITDDVVILGTRDVDLEVVMALHDEGGETLAEDDGFRSEVARLPRERIATLYTRAASLRAGLLGATGALGVGQLATLELLANLLPLDQVGALVLAEDRIVLERWQPTGDGQPDERRADRPAELVPGDAQLYAELPEFGRLISSIGAAVRRDGQEIGGQQGAFEVARVEDALGRPLDEVGDWLGDLAIGGSSNAAGSAGMAGVVTDPDAAGEVLDGVTDLLIGSGVPVEQAEVDGRPLARIEVPFLFGSITLEYGLAGDAVLLGLEGFAEWLATDEPRLATDPAYTSALEEAGGLENAGVVYLPLDRWVAQLPADLQLAAVRDAIIVTFVEGDRVRSRLEIRLNEAGDR
jgi:hypothetical protein